jgi:hypothetical protein
MQAPLPIEFQKSRDFGQKINATFEFLRQNFSSLGKALFLIGGAPILIGSLTFGYFYGKMLGSVFTTNATGIDPSDNFLVGMGLSGVLMFISLIVGGVLVMAVLMGYFKLYQARKTSAIPLEDIWTETKQLFWTIFGTSFLIGVVLGVVYLIMLLPLLLLATTGVFMIMIWFISFMVIFVYISISFSLIFPIVVFEETNAFNAISRAFYLIKGKWWSTFGTLFVLELIRGTMAAIFFIPAYVFIIINAVHSMDGGISEPSLVAQIVIFSGFTLYILSSFILYAIPLTGVNFQYFNLVELKESKGLLQQINTLGETPDQKDEEEDY